MSRYQSTEYREAPRTPVAEHGLEGPAWLLRLLAQHHVERLELAQRQQAALAEVAQRQRAELAAVAREFCRYVETEVRPLEVRAKTNAAPPVKADAA